MALSDTAARKSKPREKAYKLYDEKGLFLLVYPNGSKGWRFKFRFDGKELLLSLGVYPDVSLKDARERRDEARKLMAQGINPSLHRQVQKSGRADRLANSFEVVAKEWFAKKSPTWATTHSSKIIRRLEREVFPWLGSRPVAEITAPEILAVLRRVEARGKHETAHRTQQNCSQVFRYAVATGRAVRDPTPDLRGALTPVKPKHFASIKEPQAIGELMRAIESYGGTFPTKVALKLAPLTFVRPGELRKARWEEFDLEKAEWRIPAVRMKGKIPHIVPLANQAVAILRELHPLTSVSEFVFPGIRDSKRPMSENTVNAALRGMGYTKEVMTGHGFRSMASTRLNEQGWNPDAIERQLAHKEKNAVRAAYNFAEHLPERRKMMQAWADYLDNLAAGDKVVAINGRAA